MSNRDDLAKLLADDWNPDRDPILTAMFRDYAATILKAGWRPPARTIETDEELDALPEGSVVLDRQHDVAEKHSGRLFYRETRNMPLEYLAKHYGPFTVLWEMTKNA